MLTLSLLLAVPQVLLKRGLNLRSVVVVLIPWPVEEYDWQPLIIIQRPRPDSSGAHFTKTGMSIYACPAQAELRSRAGRSSPA